MPADAKPILVIGSLNMDLVARCEHLPERGQTIMGRAFFTAPGGKGANQAVAAARLGGRVSMAGCVGRDAFGEALVASLRDAGIRIDDVVSADGPTGTALITIDAEGANTIVVISGANLACDAALVDRALAGAGGPGILLLQHEIPAAANARAIRAARRAGWFVMLNPAPARPLPAELLPLDRSRHAERNRGRLDCRSSNRQPSRCAGVRAQRAGHGCAGGGRHARRRRGDLLRCVACLALSDRSGSGGGYDGSGRRLYRRAGGGAGGAQVAGGESSALRLVPRGWR